MKILLLGLTQSGKTTTSKVLGGHLDFHVYPMSKMFRETYVDNDSISLTEHSKNLLSNNPNVNMEYIQDYFKCSVSDIDNTIFEGFRNPEEFIKFLDKNTVVVVLKPSFMSYKDDFEKYGILACENISLWRHEVGTIKNVFVVDYSCFEELNYKVVKLTKELHDSHVKL